MEPVLLIAGLENIGEGLMTEAGGMDNTNDLAAKCNGITLNSHNVGIFVNPVVVEGVNPGSCCTDGVKVNHDIIIDDVAGTDIEDMGKANDMPMDCIKVNVAVVKELRQLLHCSIVVASIVRHEMANLLMVVSMRELAGRGG